MSVPDIYKFRITNQYQKTADDISEIDNDSYLEKEWEKGYTNFKSNIRAHLKNEQMNKCAFCRCRVSIGTSYSNLEHLVPKKQYTQFTFKEDNLVYSCHICNFSKTKKNTLTNPVPRTSQQQFPDNSQGFNIVNPYYDDYEIYLDFLDDIIIVNVNNSVKGANTIEFYKLFRPGLAEERAFRLELDKADLEKKLILRLTDPTIDKVTIDQINSIIVNLPTWVLEE